MAQSKRLRRNLSLVAITTALTVGVWAAGCGGGDDTSSFPTGNDGGGDGQALGDGNNIGFNNDGSTGDNDGSAAALVISPPNPTIDVTITNGVLTTSSVNFVAKTLAGNPVAASWSLDRGELGSLVTGTGVFTAGGTVAGTGTVSAAYGASIAKTNVTVVIHATQVGNDYDGGTPEAGAGGIGGVGGEGLGGAVTSGEQASLTTGATAPTSKAQLGWLYPYDKTVFPRGQLAPLLQWESNLAGINAVYIHLSETGFDFKGYYSVSGASQFHQPIDQAAWAAATSSNTGDNLQVQITLLGSAGAVGPITENWIVAPGILTGTIYYQTYASSVAGSAGTLAIRPGKTDPTLAIPGTKDKCVVCHEVSGDGSTLIAQDNQIISGNNDYSKGSSYDLTNDGGVIQSYTGNASDGSSNNRKFLWSAVSKDGTFALANLNRTREAYAGTEHVYRRDNGDALSTPGLQVVTEAVTPDFSRDEKSVAFNGWTLTADAGAPSGNGHTLDVMDVDCNTGDAGTTAGSAGAPPSCASIDFTNLRRLYTNADQTNGWVGWPAWTPDSQGIVFHNAVRAATESSSYLATWDKAEAQLWYTNVPPASGKFDDGGTAPAADPIKMFALNGLNAGGATQYLPLPADVTGANANHSDDAMYNYEPTANPIASGGYYWVVFTSRRMYGNIATADAYTTDQTHPIPKKLWVAAIDINPAPGTDPSHPAFYLPGQELNAPNMRGFWVVDPCRSNGSSCETGDECCNGFCRAPDDGGGLVCGDKPPGCAQELEKCTTTADCCGAGSLTCINGTCSKPSPR